MKKFLVSFFVLVILSQSIFASGGSLYSRYGIGDLYHHNSAVQLSLGGLGTSVMNSKFLNTSNPATLFSLKNTKFGGGVISTTSMLDDGNDKATYSSVKFSGFHIAFPIKEDLGIGFILGMKPYSVVNYDVINISNEGTDEQLEEQFSGSGGISKIFFGASILLPLDVAFGATFDYYTGNVQYNSNYTYSNSSNLFNSFFINEYKYKGLGATLGLESPNLNNLFEVDGITDFRIGAFYEISGALNTDTAIVVRTSIGESTFRSDKFDTKLPAKLGIGLNVTFSDKYLVVLDYLYQPWSKFEHNGLNSSSLRDLSRYSLGIEYGDQLKRFASFWELIKYRGGLSYESSQFTINGTGITQLGIHAGISLPLGLENTIDLGLMYGIRGTTDSNLVKENIIQASISLNFGELWFLRREW